MIPSLGLSPVALTMWSSRMARIFSTLNSQDVAENTPGSLC
jgi:hypothetical protein